MDYLKPSFKSKPSSKAYRDNFDEVFGNKEEKERQAIALYAIMARDFTDFLDLLPEASEHTLKTLHKMLKHPGTDDTDTELNNLGLSVLEPHMEERGIDVE